MFDDTANDDEEEEVDVKKIQIAPGEGSNTSFIVDNFVVSRHS